MLSFLSTPLFLASAALAGYVARDGTASTTNSTVDMVAAAWYTGWHSQNFTVANISWDKYTHLTFSFAVTTPDVTKLTGDIDDEKDVLTNLVKTAHEKGVKVLVSVGGWTGSRYYSSHVATPENRTAFVKTITDLKTTYNLDGVDFDWEYPGNQGIGCNVISANDTTNFLSFLQELRQDPVGKDMILTAATSSLPWHGLDGTALTDVSGFARVLDYVAIMNYDIWGHWSTAVGPNSPLNDTCAPTADQQGSAVSSVKAWTAAGMPLHQIVLGVASYGHSFSVAVDDAFECQDENDNLGVLAAYPPFDAATYPTGDTWDDGAGTDVCGNATPAGGNFDFWGLVQGGFLNENGTVNAAGGIEYRFDECSQTAYVYNETSKVMVSFDDAPAFAAKGKFIQSEGLRGFAMWEAGGDFKDILLDSIRLGAGFSEIEGDGDDDDC
ncbi:chitinase [Irpex rosettiformis]|uniref:Chitinase n=1 Tax=Irpex rosettiformis TaxID=378272 RepID=A0ACB8TSN2_9APHY|nr:chitinase [Irpex rosettiformis]